MEKNKALQLIKKNERAICYARTSVIMDISPQYEPIITELSFRDDEFVHVGGGNQMPLKSAVNKISDATGVSFTENCGTRVKGSWSEVVIEKSPDGFFSASGDYGIIGFAQGERIKPDGTVRRSSICEYEFSVTDRFNLECLNEKTAPRSMAAARKKLLELKKFSTARASTGAELRAIRELAGIPTAFSGEQIKRPMLFAQIIESSDYKMKMLEKVSETPEGKEAIAREVLGTTKKIFGEPETIREASLESMIEDIEPEEDEVELFGESQKNPDEEKIKEIKVKLEEYLLGEELSRVSQDSRNHISELINDPEIGLSDLAEALASVEQYLEKKKVKQNEKD